MSAPADTAKVFTAAVVQMTSGRDPAENAEVATELIRQAAKDGAHYIQTPEVTTLMETDREKSFANSTPQDDSLALKKFRTLAKDLGVWLHIGSMPILIAPQRLANRAFVLSPDGAIAAHYDKIHMFDVALPGEENYDESRNYRPGDRAVVTELPWATLGLSICYDVRFAYLYRAMAKAGANVLTIPAAFTKTTGTAHWHTLVTARAIETGCFVIAAGQTGSHACGRETFGHSLIVSPWGKVLADAGIDVGIALAEIDTRDVDDVRGRVGALRHDRWFEIDAPAGAKPKGIVAAKP